MYSENSSINSKVINCSSRQANLKGFFNTAYEPFGSRRVESSASSHRKETISGTSLCELFLNKTVPKFQLILDSRIQNKDC